MEELQTGFAAQKKDLEAEYQKQVDEMYFFGYRFLLMMRMKYPMILFYETTFFPCLTLSEPQYTFFFITG